MEILCFFIIAAVSYLIGSLNFAIIVSTDKNDDVRLHGSHNAGLTNMLRTYGKTAALLTLIGDVSKGLFTVGIARIICDILSLSQHSEIAVYGAMFFTVIGHIFPLYFRFKGGKGVLTSAACLAAIDYRVFLIIIAVFIVLVLYTRYVSLSSMMGAIAAVISTAAFTFSADDSLAVWKTLIIAVIASILIIKHKENILRLVNGTENKLSLKDKK